MTENVGNLISGELGGEDRDEE